MHLRWSTPPLPVGGDGRVRAVAATFVVERLPSVPRLYFWALQASFVDGPGRSHGAAHLGLQWHQGHPGSTAVNFGGYAARGGELAGSRSPLPSARDNPNTRDFEWEAGRPYRLSIARADEGEWSGRVDETEVRRLSCPGDGLAHVVVWSEVFARCDDPTVVVRWSDLTAELDDGTAIAADRVVVSYQSYADGGCTNGTVAAAADGIRQVTGVPRTIPAGAAIGLAGPVS
jgi:hypothetical protein